MYCIFQSKIPNAGYRPVSYANQNIIKCSIEFTIYIILSNLVAHIYHFTHNLPNNFCQCFNSTAKFLKLIHHAVLEPPKKYTEPQTESQEIGWFSTPLVSRTSVKAKYCGKTVMQILKYCYDQDEPSQEDTILESLERAQVVSNGLSDESKLY